MATLPNFVLVPCALGPTLTTVNQVNAAALYRTPRPQPFNVSTIPSSGPTLPTGPQWWPITG